MVMRESASILIAEDDSVGVLLTLSVLSELGIGEQVTVVEDGEQLLDYLYRRGPFQNRSEGHPTLILLDLKMPKLTGLDVLRQIKSDASLRVIPKVVFTSSREESDIAASYDLGANAYVVKPVDMVEFRRAVNDLGAFWAFCNVPPSTPAAAS